MSWMDSWSRPSANSTIPAPLYLSNENVPYCHSCGRAMTSKKSAKKTESVIKYCSDRCRSRKPGPWDRKIENVITALLNGDEDSGIEKTAAQSRRAKGDPRNIITCDEIEEIVYGSRFDPEKVYGRRKNRKSRAIRVKPEDWKSVDMESSEADLAQSSSDEDEEPQMGRVGGAPIRPPQDQSEVNFSVGGERNRAEKIEESATDLEKRREGDRRAEERETVRRAARRVIIFGAEVSRAVIEQKPGKKARKAKQHDEGEHTSDESSTMIRKAEAIMAGTVVEPSFAKGNWSIRWRE